MEFSSSSDDDGVLEWQMRRQQRLLRREDAAVVRADGRRGNGGAAVTLPSGQVVEHRKGTIFVPVRDRFVHVHDAKARPQEFFGDPSVRVARRPRMRPERVVLLELTAADGWREVSLPAASVTGVFALHRVLPDTSGDSSPPSPSPPSPPPPLQWQQQAVVVDGVPHICLPDFAARPSSLPASPSPPPPPLQRKIDLGAWEASQRRGAGGLRCVEDLTWPADERMCTAAAADEWGTVWAFCGRDGVLGTVAVAPPSPSLPAGGLVKHGVAVIPADGGTGNPLGLIPLPDYRHGDDDSGSGGAAVIVREHCVSLALLPPPSGSGGPMGPPPLARTAACPDSRLPYGSWCTSHAGGSTPVWLALGSERGVSEVHFDGPATTPTVHGHGSRWAMRQARYFPKSRRVMALGGVGRVDADGVPRVLLSGMRNGTIQACHVTTGSGSGGGGVRSTGAAYDTTARHHNASVVSLHQLSTHEFQFASVDSNCEARVWDLRYFDAGSPVAVARAGTRMNYGGYVRVSWCGDVAAVISEAAGIYACVNAAAAAIGPDAGQWNLAETGPSPLGREHPTPLLSCCDVGYRLFLFGGSYNRCITLDGGV